MPTVPRANHWKYLPLADLCANKFVFEGFSLHIALSLCFQKKKRFGYKNLLCGSILMLSFGGIWIATLMMEKKTYVTIANSLQYLFICKVTSVFQTGLFFLQYSHLIKFLGLTKANINKDILLHCPLMAFKRSIMDGSIVRWQDWHSCSGFYRWRERRRGLLRFPEVFAV